MEILTSAMDDLGLNDHDIDLSAFDFQSLGGTIKHESFWVLQLETMDLIDPAGNPVDAAQASEIPGVRPTFMIYCYDDKTGIRLTHDCINLPASDVVLQSVPNNYLEVIVAHLMLSGRSGDQLQSQSPRSSLLCPGFYSFLANCKTTSLISSHFSTLSRSPFIGGWRLKRRLE
jgi:hypothetical protein